MAHLQQHLFEKDGWIGVPKMRPFFGELSEDFFQERGRKKGGADDQSVSEGGLQPNNAL